MRRLLGLIVLSTVASGLAPSAQAGERVYVRIGPPAAVVEVRTAAPSPHHVWVDGYHRWEGGAYVWVPGRWAVPPTHYTAWVPGHWVNSPHHGWYWAEGHWRH